MSGFIIFFYYLTMQLLRRLVLKGSQELINDPLMEKHL